MVLMLLMMSNLTIMTMMMVRDDDDNNAHRGYSPDPGSEYKDSEGILCILF